MADQDPYAGLGAPSAPQAPQADPYDGLGVAPKSAPGASNVVPAPTTPGAVADSLAGGINQGVADLAGTPAAMYNLSARYTNAMYKRLTGHDAPKWLIDEIHHGTPDEVENAVRSTGLPVGNSPEANANPTLRYTGAAGRGLSTAVAPETILPGVLGSVASQGAQDAGAPPLVQAAAGLAAGLSPTAAKMATQKALGVVPEVAQQNIANANAVGAQPTVGMAAGPGSNAQVLEKGLSMVPGAAGTMRNATAAANNAAGQTISDITTSLGAGNGTTAAGGAAQAGLSQDWIPSVNKTVRTAFDARNAAVPKGTPVDVSKFMARVAQLRQESPAFDKYINGDPVFQRIEQDLAKQSPWQPTSLKNAQGQPGYINTQTNQLSFTPPPPVTTLPFEEADIAQRGLNQLVDYSFVKGNETNLINGTLSQAAKALSGDVSSTLATIPKAAALDSAAKTLYSQASEAKGRLRSVLNSDTPEKAFNAMMSGARDGDTMLDTAMRGLSVPDQNVVSATIFQKMGRATPGAQNAAGDAWSANTFLTNWNRLSDGAKATLTRNLPPSYRDQLSQFSAYADNIKGGNAIYANPSGTAPAHELAHAVGAVSTVGNALLSGHPHVAAAIIAPYAMASLTAKAMTNPGVVRWLAASTRLPTSSVPIIASQLGRIASQTGDPQLAQLVTQLQNAGQ